MTTSLKEEHRKELHDLLLSIDPNTLRTRLLEMSEAHDNIAQLLHKHLVTPEQVDIISSSEDEDFSQEGSESDSEAIPELDSELEIVEVKNSHDAAGTKRSHPITISDLVNEDDSIAKRVRSEHDKIATSASCTHCSKIFTLENNEEGDCGYHPGINHSLILSWTASPR